MFNTILKRSFSLIGMVALILCFSLVLFTKDVAAMDSFKTDRYDVEVVANEDNTFHVKETITVYFSEPKHGIFRYIPYKAGEVAISDIEVSGDEYQVSTETSGLGTKNKLVKIGDPDKTVTGTKTYTIKYKLVGLDDKEKQFDLLTLDLLPKEWETPIAASTVSLKMPKYVDWSRIDFLSGDYNLDDYNESFKIAANGKSLIVEGSNIGYKKGLTLYGKLPEGYWESFGNRNYVVYPIMAVLILIPFVLFLMWLKFGRDDKVVEVVEFYPPDRLDPAELSYLAKGSSSPKDLVSLVPYFADKGYLSINMYDDDNFRLIRLVKDLPEYESRIARHVFYNTLFPNGSVEFDSMAIYDDTGKSLEEGITILIDDGKSRNKVYKWSSVFASGLARVLLAVVPALCLFLTDFSVYGTPSLLYLAICIPLFLAENWFSYMVMAGKANKKIKRIGGILISGLAVLCISGMCSLYILKILGIYPAVAFTISTAISTVLMSIMVSRTEKNIKIYGRILGFRTFIETAELDRITALAEENPKYFHNILPYAYVLDLSDKWISKFETLNTPSPSWWQGGYINGVFNPYLFDRAITNLKSSYTDAYTSAVSKSVDLGGGGGNFSGGGFGGGGGGSW